MLRIVTYNIHSGKDILLRNRLHQMKETLRILQPDIIALQEVHENRRFGYQLTYLAEELRMSYAFFPPKTLKGGGYGSALLSHLPIINSKSMPLQAKREPRSLLQATLCWKNKWIDCWVAHLSLDSRSRTAQMNKLYEAVEQHQDSPLLLLGDFNTSVPIIHPCLQDCGTILGHSRHSTLVPLFRRVDFILATPDWLVTQYEVIPVKWSDHFPVVVTLELSELLEPELQTT